MEGAQKNFELLFKLTASLGGNFNKTFNAALQAQKRLSESVKNVNSLQSKIDGYNKANAAIEQNRGKLQRLTAEHDRLQSELAQTAQKKRDLQRAMETAEAEGNIEEYKRLQKELSDTNKEYSRLNEKYKANQNQIQQATAKIEEQQRSLEELAQELREAGLNTDDLERANERLKNSYERLQASQERLKNLNQQQERIKQNISATKTEILGTVGAYTAVAAAIYAGPVQAAQKYETALAKVNTIADTTKVPLDKISQEVMALSNKTGVAANALAEDVYNAISAGQKTGDAVNFVSYSTKLAKAGFAETSQTLDVLTTILNAYGDKVGTVSDVSDMLIQIQNKGKVSVGELSSVMGKIIPTANASNVALEQLGATYAIMTAGGIPVAETTTYANSMLKELSKSGSTADKILRKVAGGGFSDLMANGSSLAEVLDILQTEAQKSGKTISDMFGSGEAGTAALKIMEAGVDGFNASVQGMINSKDATDNAFAIMADTTESKMAKAKNSINNLQIVLGQNLLPIVGNVADKVAGVVTKVSEFAQANPQLAQTVMKVVGALAALKLGGLGLKLGFQEISLGVNKVQKVLEVLHGGFLTAKAGSIGLLGKIKNLGKSFGTLGGIKNLLGGMGGIAGKILPIVAVVTAVITVVQLLRKNFDKVREAVGRIFGDKGLEIFDKIVAAVTAAGDAIKNVFSGGNMDAARQKIESIFGAKGTAVFDGFIRAAQTVGSAIGSLIGFITEHVVPVAEQVLGVIVSDVIPGIVGGIQQAAPVIMQIVQSIAGFIAGIIPVIGGFIAGIMPVISEIITFVQTNVFPIVQQIFSFIVSSVLPTIVSGVQFLATTITAVLSAVLPVVQNVFTTIWNIIQPILQLILSTVQTVLPIVLSVFQSVFSAIGGVVNGLASVLSGLIQFITGVFSGNWAQAWEGIKNVFSGVWDSLTSIAKGVINGIIGVINGAISGLNKIKIPDWVPVVGGKGVNIPTIPTFARGTTRTPGTFIAGEKGPELITNAPGMTVYTAERTQKILETSNRAAAAVKAAPAATQVESYGGNPVAEVKTAPEVTRNPGRGGGTQNLTVNNSPTIIVQGDKPDDLDQKLEANNQKLIREIREMQRQDAEDERRAVYE